MIKTITIEYDDPSDKRDEYVEEFIKDFADFWISGGECSKYMAKYSDVYSALLDIFVCGESGVYLHRELVNEHLSKDEANYYKLIHQLFLDDETEQGETLANYRYCNICKQDRVFNSGRGTCTYCSADSNAVCDAKKNVLKANPNYNGPHFTLDEWRAKKKYYNYICQRCGKQEPEISLTVDHIIPLSSATNPFTNAIYNIQPLCRLCNPSKGTYDTDYRVDIQNASDCPWE